MCKLFSLPVWFLLALAWSGFVFYLAMQSWPQVPLDMSAGDPATVEALRGAMFRHAFAYGAVAALPPAILLGLGWFFCRRGGPGA